MVKCSSRDFGQIEIREEDILSFQTPLFGFEQYTKFALLHNKEIGESLAWLQSLEAAPDESAVHLLVNRITVYDTADIRITSDLQSVVGDAGWGRTIDILPTILFSFSASETC